MTENPAKLFDDILKLLAKDYNKIYTFEEIQRNIFPEDFNFSPDEPVFESLVLENPNAINIQDALMFLNKQGLVAVNFDVNECFINTAGFIKIKTQGFQDEIEEKQTNLRLQRWTWRVLPIAAILTATFAGLAFLLSLSKFLYYIFCEN